MPTRIVREGILTSEPINSLSERAEIFYRRLMSVADDYGRYYAHPGILRAHCFPVILERYSEADVKQMLSECAAKGVLSIYGDGKYLQVHKFRQQTRSASKFPQPTESELLSKCEANDKPMCSLVGVGVVSGDVSGGGGGDGQENHNSVTPPPLRSAAPPVADALPMPNPSEVLQLLKYVKERFQLPERDANTERIRGNITELLARGFTLEQVRTVATWATSEQARVFRGRPQSATSMTDPMRFGQWLQTMQDHSAEREHLKNKARR